MFTHSPDYDPAVSKRKKRKRKEKQSIRRAPSAACPSVHQPGAQEHCPCDLPRRNNITANPRGAFSDWVRREWKPPPSILILAHRPPLPFPPLLVRTLPPPNESPPHGRTRPAKVCEAEVLWEGGLSIRLRPMLPPDRGDRSRDASLMDELHAAPPGVPAESTAVRVCASEPWMAWITLRCGEECLQRLRGRAPHLHFH